MYCFGGAGTKACVFAITRDIVPGARASARARKAGGSVCNFYWPTKGAYSNGIRAGSPA